MEVHCNPLLNPQKNLSWWLLVTLASIHVVSWPCGIPKKDIASQNLDPTA